ncbi:MAG: hypothetical protein HY721_14205 [Planctomycetes bacterium]|nr:hypothetical protein [Planctomycetota bacterium]
MESRRKFLKKVLYATPAVLTVAVRPARAATGYGGDCGVGNGAGVTGGHGGGNKDAHDWWQLWRKL